MNTPQSRALSDGAVDFIDDGNLEHLLGRLEPASSEVRDIIAKSLARESLEVAETAVLLRTRQPELVEEIFEAARRLKREVYGNRIVLFAPSTSATSASTTACTAGSGAPALQPSVATSRARTSSVRYCHSNASGTSA